MTAIPARIPIERHVTPREARPTRTADGTIIPLAINHQVSLASFNTWVVRIPSHYSIEDLLDPALWRKVELTLQARTGRPQPHDLIRAIADDGSYDAFFVVAEVNRGYRLVFSHGRLPEGRA